MSFKDIKYAPQMPLHKLARSNMTTITQANLGKAMGDLNRFFPHDNVCKLTGFRFEVVGQKLHVMPDGYKFKTDIEDDRQVPIYHPVPKGRCKIHSLWRDHLAGKGAFSRNPDEIPRFSISSIYEAHCNPIGIGDRYKIFGNRLIIYTKWDKYIHHTPWMRYSEYIQVPEVDPDAYLQMQINGCHEMMYDEMYYVHESLFGRISSKYDEEDISKVIKDFHEQVSEFVEDEIRRYDGADEWKELILKESELDEKEHPITFRFNPHLFLTHGWEGEKCCYEYVKYNPEDPDATITSLVHAVVGAYQSWINEQNADYAEAHRNDPEPSYGCDYDPWDW